MRWEKEGFLNEVISFPDEMQGPVISGTQASGTWDNEEYESSTMAMIVSIREMKEKQVELLNKKSMKSTT